MTIIIKKKPTGRKCHERYTCPNMYIIQKGIMTTKSFQFRGGTEQFDKQKLEL